MMPTMSLSSTTTRIICVLLVVNFCTTISAAAAVKPLNTQKPQADAQCTDGSGNVPYNTPCYFPFIYLQNNYSSCIEQASGYFWCATVPDYDGTPDAGWGYCKSCSVDPCVSYGTSCRNCTSQGSCGWCKTTQKCVPGSAVGPYVGTCATYQPDGYCDNLCNQPATIPLGYVIDTAAGGCPNNSDAASCKIKCASGFSGPAVVSCPNDQGEYEFTGCLPVNTNTQYCTDGTAGSDPYNTPCYLPFLYYGTLYTSCNQDGSTPWCSTIADYGSDTSRWGYCKNCSYDPCAQYKQCGDCASQSNCVWCPTSKTCVPGSSSGPFANGTCPAFVAYTSSCPPPDPCPGASDCATCSDSAFTSQGCAWCPTAVACQATASNTCSGGFYTGIAANCPDPCAIYGNSCSKNCTIHPACGFCESTLKCLTGSGSGPDSGSCAGWKYNYYDCIDYDPCPTASDCYSCAQLSGTKGCAWCQTTGTCQKPASTSCASGFINVDTSCPDSCSVYSSSCSTNCTLQSGCGFCETTQKCQSGSSSAPYAGTCATWRYTSTECSDYDVCAASGSSGCGACAAVNPQCGWCVTTGSCHNTSRVSCAATYVSNATLCPDDCVPYNTSCANCTAQLHCGYCASTQTCHTGTLDAPEKGSCLVWKYQSLQCAADYDYCQALTSHGCAGCLDPAYASFSCGWCASSGTCASTVTSTCPSGGFTTGADTNCPNPCVAYSNCTSCFTNPSCEWCKTTNMCNLLYSAADRACTAVAWPISDCPDYDWCPTYSGSCGECLSTTGAAHGCGWCTATSTCQRTNTSTCDSGFLIGSTDALCPDPCSVYSNCVVCATAPDCAWCNSTGICNTYHGTNDRACGASSIFSTAYCPPFVCNLPASLPAGYAVGSLGCRNGSTETSCYVQCAVGMQGFAVATCPDDKSTFQLSGCYVDPCNEFGTSCSNCTEQNGCGWCDATRQCITGTSAGPNSNSGQTTATCPIWLWEPTDCLLTDYCGYFTNCQSCSNSAYASYGCGWCPKAWSCLKKVNHTCAGSGYYLGDSASCPDPCLVETDCRNCTAHTQCSWCNTTTTCNTHLGTADLACALTYPTQALCPLPFRCYKPTVMPAGYTIASCANNSTDKDCYVSCGAGYHGSPWAWCPRDNSTFLFFGCILNQCSLPASLGINYTYSSGGCPALSTVVSCGGLRCAYGYNGIVSTTCATNGGTFTLSGCGENFCTLPALSAGYVTSQCTGSRVMSNCSLSCAANFVGAPYATCDAPGNFTIHGACKPVCSGYTCATFFRLKEDPQDIVCLDSGCDIPTCCDDTRTCNKPAVLPVGYVIGFAGCLDGAVARNCFMECAPGYLGQAYALCDAEGGNFTFGGCSLDTRICTKPSPLTVGYAITNCSDGSRAVNCLIRCSAGLAGTPMAACVVNNTNFIFSGCSSTVPVDFRGWADFWILDTNSRRIGYAALYQKADKLLVSVTSIVREAAVTVVKILCDSSGGIGPANDTCVDMVLNDPHKGVWWQPHTLSPAIFQQIITGNAYLTISFYPSMPTFQRMKIPALLGNPVPNFYGELFEQPQKCTNGTGLAPNNSVCSFPFTYNGITYNDCTPVDNGGVPWCDDINGNWGECTSCAPTGDFGRVFIWFNNISNFANVRYYTTIVDSQIDFDWSGIYSLYPSLVKVLGLGSGSALSLRYKADLYQERLWARILNHTHHRYITSRLLNWEAMSVDAVDPTVNLEAYLDFLDRGYDDASLSVAFNLPVANVGNEIWVHFPMEYDISHIRAYSAVGVKRNFTSVDIDFDQQIVKLRWPASSWVVPYSNVTSLGQPQATSPWLVILTFLHVATPNNCENVTFTVTTHQCYDEDLFGAGIHFVHHCPPNATDVTISAITPYGRPWGCSICNSCKFAYKALNGDDVFVCEQDQKTFARINVLQKPGCLLQNSGL